MSKFPQIEVQLVIKRIARGINPDYAESGIPIINQKCVRPLNKIDMQFCKYQKDDDSPLEKTLQVEKGDIFVNPLGDGTLGRAAHVNFEVSEALTWDRNLALITPDHEKVCSRFLGWSIHSKEEELVSCRLGGTNQLMLPTRAILHLKVPFPPLETQQRIADYLDKETGEIDEMIENLEGLVGDLNNRKFQIVDDVLHGKVRVLNRESVDFAPLWKFAEVNPLTPEINQLDESEMVAFVPLEDVYPQNAKDDLGQISLGGNITSYTRFRNGDVLLPKVSPTVWHGRAMIADTNTSVGLASSEVHVLRAYEGINTRWIQLHFLSKSFLDEVRGELTGVAGLQRVSPLFIRNMKMMSISREEQDKIVAYLDEELTDLIEILEQCSGLIEDLKARRSALITGVVSGRKEV